MKAIETTRISSKGQITIPTSIRKAFKIKSGQTFTFQLKKDGILIKPVDITVTDLTANQAWMEGLEAALADLKAGRVKHFGSEKEFMAHLEQLSAHSKKS